MICKKCGEAKSTDEFYASNQTACKECIKAAVRKNRQANLDYYREYDRERGNRQPPEYLKQYRQENPEKYKAHNAVNNALRDGRLAKPNRCEGCGNPDRLHGHHEDYSRPLEVKWLCPGCHKAEHTEGEEHAARL